MSNHRARRFRNNLRIERDNAALYGRLADLAADERLARVYRRIAAGETANAGFWEARLRELGEAVPPVRIGLQADIADSYFQVLSLDERLAVAKRKIGRAHV